MAIQIPPRMLPDIEASRLAEWKASDDCRRFPVCLAPDEDCNPECAVPRMQAARKQEFGDACQWGAL